MKAYALLCSCDGVCKGECVPRDQGFPLLFLNRSLSLLRKKKSTLSWARGSFTLFSAISIVLDCFYLLISSILKNLTLNLSLPSAVCRLLKRDSKLSNVLTYFVSFCVFLFVAPCKGIQDSLGFWIPGTGFRIIGFCHWNLDSGFQ